MVTRLIMSNKSHTPADATKPQRFPILGPYLLKGGLVFGVLALVTVASYYLDPSCSNPVFAFHNAWCSAPR